MTLAEPGIFRLEGVGDLFGAATIRPGWAISLTGRATFADSNLEAPDWVLAVFPLAEQQFRSARSCASAWVQNSKSRPEGQPAFSQSK